MSQRQSPFGHPSLLGFDGIEQLLDRLGKSAGDGYPPFNIERVASAGKPETIRILLAVAGFTPDQLEVEIEDNQLVVKGRQVDERERTYIHRGIAARQFQRCFVLADGMEVVGADLRNGLLSIDLVRPEPSRITRRVEIVSRD